MNKFWVGVIVGCLLWFTVPISWRSLSPEQQVYVRAAFLGDSSAKGDLAWMHFL